MRIVFYLVALANVALFMWEYDQGAFDPAENAKTQEVFLNQEPIILVSELTPAVAGADQAVTDAPDANPPSVDNPVAVNSGEGDMAGKEIKPLSGAAVDGAPAGREPSAAEPGTVASSTPVAAKAEDTGRGAVNCYEAGPFASDKLYQAWHKRLAAAGANVVSLPKQEQAVGDYVVVYPAGSSMTESRANLQMLRNQGLRDLWMVGKGDGQGQILLGIFAREERAQRMQSQMQARGIKTEVKARYKDKLQKYAVIKGGAKVAESLEVLKRTYPKVVVKAGIDSANGCLIKQPEPEPLKPVNPAAKVQPVVHPVEPRQDQTSTAGPLPASNRVNGGIAGKSIPAGGMPVSAKSLDDAEDKVSCYEAGPIASDRLYRDWSRKLAGAGTIVKTLHKQGQEIAHYLVFYPTAETLSKSRENLEMLKSQGIKDLWMAGKGDDEGLISLGVFSKEERAKLMQAQLRAKGINAEVKARYKNKAQKYVMVKGGGKLADSIGALKKSFPEIEVQLVTDAANSCF